jgi:CheY-like chemotaxis protein
LKFTDETSAPRIVIVDDNQALVAVYLKFFSIAGFSVLASFSSGSDLLNFFDKKDADPPHPGEDIIVLMDDRMPSMSGLDTASRLKRIRGTTKVILCTNENPSAMILPAEIVDAVMQKPFSIEEFLEIVDRLIHPSHQMPNRKLADRSGECSDLWTR